VKAWEPVPTFRAFFEYGLQMNSFQAQVEVRTAVVGGVAGQKLQLVVPNRGIWGTAGVDGMNIDHAIKNDGAFCQFALMHVELCATCGCSEFPQSLSTTSQE
jgi:hypothetical protein